MGRRGLCRRRFGNRHRPPARPDPAAGQDQRPRRDGYHAGCGLIPPEGRGAVTNHRSSRPAGEESMPWLSKLSPAVLALLRVVTALLFLEHGLMKLIHFPAAQQGVPDPLPLIPILAAIIEIIGGGLVALGLFTRIAALIC